MPQHIRQYGLNQGQQNKEPSEWEKYLQQAKLAMSMDGETALGLALGKAIRYFWDKHLAERNEEQDRAARKAKELKAGGNWTDADIDWAKKNGQDLSQASPDMVSVVDTKGNINPRFAPKDVPAQYVPQHEVVDTTGVILDPTTQRQALFNQRTADAVNGNLSDNDLRKALAGFWR